MKSSEYYTLLNWALGNAGCWAGSLPQAAADKYRAKLKTLRKEVTARRRAENGTVPRTQAVICRSLNLHR